jgi:hypothetical protein
VRGTDIVDTKFQSVTGLPPPADGNAFDVVLSDGETEVNIFCVVYFYPMLMARLFVFQMKALLSPALGDLVDHALVVPRSLIKVGAQLFLVV